MFASPSKTATIDIDRAEEFEGDDVDRFSSLVDLGANYKYLLVHVPEIDLATVHVYLQRDSHTDSVPSVLHRLKDNDTGSAVQETTEGAGNIALGFMLFCAQHIRIYVSDNQSADRTFYLRGYNKG